MCKVKKVQSLLVVLGSTDEMERTDFPIGRDKNTNLPQSNGARGKMQRISPGCVFLPKRIMMR